MLSSRALPNPPFPSVLHPLICSPDIVHIQMCTCAISSVSLGLFILLSFFLHSLRWQIFKEQLHTRVVLVAVEMWTDKDQIPISVSPLEMLRDFSKYRQQSIKHHADAVHLFSYVSPDIFVPLSSFSCFPICAMKSLEIFERVIARS